MEPVGSLRQTILRISADGAVFWFERRCPIGSRPQSKTAETVNIADGRDLFAAHLFRRGIFRRHHSDVGGRFGNIGRPSV